jgi:hypothetical protein
MTLQAPNRGNGGHAAQRHVLIPHTSRSGVLLSSLLTLRAAVCLHLSHTAQQCVLICTRRAATRFRAACNTPPRNEVTPRSTRSSFARGVNKVQGLQPPSAMNRTCTVTVSHGGSPPTPLKPRHSPSRPCTGLRLRGKKIRPATAVMYQRLRSAARRPPSSAIRVADTGSRGYPLHAPSFELHRRARVDAPLCALRPSTEPGQPNLPDLPAAACASAQPASERLGPTQRRSG